MFKFRVNAICSIVLCCGLLVACGLNKNRSASVDDSQGSAVKAVKASIVQKLKEFDHLPVEQRVALYYQLKKESPDAYTFGVEDEMTMYGYGLLWNKKVSEAVAIFKLIVAEYPNSANAYDSLGEGYLSSGDTAMSLANYNKSLALNPDNFNAEDYIERIKNPNKKPEKPTERFVKMFTPEQYKADLDQLGQTLTTVHPNALKFISKEAFWKTIEAKKALITPNTTYGDFAWHCNEIIANLHCSHTTMGGFYPENAMLPLDLRFPLQTRWVNNQLFVIDPLNNADQVKVKDEILSINGVAIATIISGIYKHIPAQGYVETTKKHYFNWWSTGLIPYELGFPETYTIVTQGGKTPIVLSKATTFKDPHDDSSIKRCDNGLCFEVLADDPKTAILTIATFNYYPWNNLSVFITFMDKTFVEIQQKGIKNLIIDVRFNGGGSQQSSIHLLRYLMAKPFLYYSRSEFEGKIEKIDGEEMVAPFENRFRGKCYFLMDGNGQSTTGHFMSLVKVFKLGTIVGEELGSNQFCSAGQKICRLANTKLEYYVANNTHESTATSLPDEVGILPDHYVTQSMEEYLGKVDAVKDFTVKLIRSKK